MNFRMNVCKKLGLSFGAAFLLTLLVGLVSLHAGGSLGAVVDRLIHVNARKQFLAEDINVAASFAMALERGIFVRTYKKDPATVERYSQQFQENQARFASRVEEFAALSGRDEDRQAVEDLQVAKGEMLRNHQEMMRHLHNSELDEAFKVYDVAMPRLKQVKVVVERLAQAQGERMDAEGRSASALIWQNRWTTIVTICLSVLVGVVVAFVVIRISKTLRQVVSELADGAEQTASAATQVSIASQSLAQGASEQAASLEETSASTEQINSMALRNSEHSRTAAGLTAQSEQKFADANRSLDEMVASIGEINSQSDKISKIIKVIDEIAFQTNILALNAAVEAARAGEAGMGFAVVADEVRHLAQRCAQAAKDTSTLIEDSIARSHDGKKKVDQVTEAIHSITVDSAQIKTLVAEVRVGSEEQAHGIEQIGKAIAQMEQVTQQSAASSEESASAAEQLNAQSETLKGVVNRLTELVGRG